MCGALWRRCCIGLQLALRAEAAHAAGIRPRPGCPALPLAQHLHAHAHAHRADAHASSTASFRPEANSAMQSAWRPASSTMRSAARTSCRTAAHLHFAPHPARHASPPAPPSAGCHSVVVMCQHLALLKPCRLPLWMATAHAMRGSGGQPPRAGRGRANKVSHWWWALLPPELSLMQRDAGMVHETLEELVHQRVSRAPMLPGRSSSPAPSLSRPEGRSPRDRASSRGT